MKTDALYRMRGGGGLRPRRAKSIHMTGGGHRMDVPDGFETDSLLDVTVGKLNVDPYDVPISSNHGCHRREKRGPKRGSHNQRSGSSWTQHRLLRFDDGEAERID